MMSRENTSPRAVGSSMRRRQITLADGRYLIFYTFEDEAVGGLPDDGVEATRPEPEAKPEAEEERSV
jgi:hypothetical protein